MSCHVWGCLVTRYKQSVIQNDNFENLISEHFPSIYTQGVPYNVYNNVVTLGGQIYFHGMGTTAVSALKYVKPLFINSPVISRLQQIKSDELVRDNAMPLFPTYAHLRDA